MKRVISMIMAIVTVLTIATVGMIPTSAASSYPSFSTSAYCEYKVYGNSIPLYMNQSCTTRGSSRRSYSYSATADPGDVCKLVGYYSSTDSFRIYYPVSGTYYSAYAKRSSLGLTLPSEVSTARGKATTYYGPTTGTYYGYTESGDRTYKVGTSGSFTKIMYTAKSGSRAYKCGYTTTSAYNSYIHPVSTPSTTKPAENSYSSQKVTENKVIYEYVTVTVDTSSMENWIKSVQMAERTVSNSGKGIIVGSKVKSTKTVSWKIPKSTVYSGPGLTGYVTRKYTVPSVIQYKLHKHTRNMGYGRNWYFAGDSIKTLYTCNCGYRQELVEWTIPLPDLSESQTTMKVIQGLPQIN